MGSFFAHLADGCYPTVHIFSFVVFVDEVCKRKMRVSQPVLLVAGLDSLVQIHRVVVGRVQEGKGSIN